MKNKIYSKNHNYKYWVYNKEAIEANKKFLANLINFNTNSKNEVVCPLFGIDDTDFNLINVQLCNHCIFNHTLDGCGGQAFISCIDDLYISKEKRYQKYENEILNLKALKTKLDNKYKSSNINKFNQSLDFLSIDKNKTKNYSGINKILKNIRDN